MEIEKQKQKEKEEWDKLSDDEIIESRIDVNRRNTQNITERKFDLTEITKEKELEQITQDLQLPIEVKEEESILNIHKQEIRLTLLTSILEQRTDNKLRKQIIEAGIVQQLIHIFETRNIDQIQ
ncbi:MAG: hypothetical protein EZS28_040051 [Streblomastix strix]|uniref:Uncharacterized protein n=1 Tax=Streblomastix strix TaxID=222440 RepID=A0A5J4U3A0_9EUKA|nr:MAG: hypothetical protein EZS28_040051 [Streblomastix strix]